MKNKPDDNIKILATGLGIPLSMEEEEIKSKGWEGQEKGLLQVLWEIGFIENTKKVKKYYTITGSKDIYGNIIPYTRLQDLMDQAPAFQNKVTLLQEILGRLGVTIHFLPKCHAKLVGKCIKNSCGFAKDMYRQLPILQKRTKDNFRNSIREVLRREHITIYCVRKFSQQAQGYICVYFCLHNGDNATSKECKRIMPQQIKHLDCDFKKTIVLWTLKENSL